MKVNDHYLQFVSLGDKMRELLIKKRKRKKKERKRKEKNYSSHDWIKKAQNFCAVLQCFLAMLK